MNATPRRVRRAILAGATIACLLPLSGGWPAHAGLGLRDPADRQSVAPLRQVDLVPTLEGGAAIPAAVAEAWGRLPERCREGGRGGLTDPCEPALRCRWLAARYQVLQAFSGGDPAARVSAARGLHRIADALRAAGRCEMKASRRETLEADLRQAELDDARVQLSELVRADERSPGGPVLDPGDQAVIDRLVTAARRDGLGSVAARDLLAARNRLATARERRAWLARQPGIAAIRSLVLAAWKPVGKVPRGCGESLFAPGRLSDQWRGWLVREEIPRALDCLATRLPAALARKGLAPRRSTAPAEAKALAETARRDAGGRRFGSDPSIVAELERLAEGLEPRRAASGARRAASHRTPSAPSRSSASRRAATGRKPSRKKAAPPKKTARNASAGSKRTTSSGPARRARIDRELVSLAERVAVRTGDDRLVRRVRAARTAAERDRELDGLVIALHRHVCAPLEQLDPRDLRAARRALGMLAEDSAEEACRAVEGRAGLERLLRVTPRLEQLRWAATVRQAAREAALGRSGIARKLLDGVDEDYRGLAWIVVRAWVARIDGDHVLASRLMTRLDGPTLSRLRVSGTEPLARLVAHAWATPRPDAEGD